MTTRGNGPSRNPDVVVDNPSLCEATPVQCVLPAGHDGECECEIDRMLRLLGGGLP